MAIGSLTLTPTFNSNTLNYAVTTENATNTVTATTASQTAQIAITVNGVAHTNGNSATWQTGDNIVLVTVSDRHTSQTYKVVVTKSGT